MLISSPADRGRRSSWLGVLVWTSLGLVLGMLASPMLVVPALGAEAAALHARLRKHPACQPATTRHKPLADRARARRAAC